MTEDEMVRWHHRLNGHEFTQTPRDSEGQGNLECCSPQGCKESDETQQLSNNHNKSSTPFVVIRCYGSDRKLYSPNPSPGPPGLPGHLPPWRQLLPSPTVLSAQPLRPSTTLFLLPDTTLLGQRLATSSHTALTPGSHPRYSLLDPQDALP